MQTASPVRVAVIQACWCDRQHRCRVGAGSDQGWAATAIQTEPWGERFFHMLYPDRFVAQLELRPARITTGPGYQRVHFVS
jgi:hypothetical protein